MRESRPTPVWFAPGGSVQSELLELPGQRVDQAALVIVQLVQTTRILSHLLVALTKITDADDIQRVFDAY
jgi:hypothetical protein